MALPSLPSMLNPDQREPALRYLWDDTRASEDFKTDASGVVERAQAMTLRARIALGVAIYEWLVWRFSGVSTDPMPAQIAEAAWCACVDRRYMDYLELDRDEWLGPVRGPLWCATTWLLPMVFFSDDEPEEWQSGLDYLVRLARHVLPHLAPFEVWLDTVMSRLETCFEAMPEDPFDDLFSERQEQRRGPLVPREVMDTSLRYQPEQAEMLIERMLAEVGASGNPFFNG
jgi:hypothetical protein